MLHEKYRFIKGRIIDISTTIVIGPKFQKFIGIVIEDQIPSILGSKIADENILIHSQPCNIDSFTDLIVDCCFFRNLFRF